MSDYTTIELDISPAGVAVVLLNRPDMSNALNAHVVDELRDVFSALSKSSNIRAVILRGAGDCLSCGEDIAWLEAAEDFSEHEYFEDAHNLSEMLRAFYELPHPTIAMVQGNVSGPAIGLVAGADAVIAHAQASFSFNELSRGYLPAAMSPYLVNAIGARMTRLLFMTVQTINADKAENLGLIQIVAQNETEMDQELERLTASIFDIAPGTIGAMKQLVEDVEGQVIDHGLAKHVAKLGAHSRASAEGREGVKAFIENRPAKWKG